MTRVFGVLVVDHMGSALSLSCLCAQGSLLRSSGNLWGAGNQMWVGSMQGRYLPTVLALWPSSLEGLMVRKQQRAGDRQICTDRPKGKKGGQNQINRGVQKILLEMCSYLITSFSDNIFSCIFSHCSYPSSPHCGV